jgi:hypothetical protein
MVNPNTVPCKVENKVIACLTVLTNPVNHLENFDWSAFVSIVV